MATQESALIGLRRQLFMVLLASFLFPCTGIGATDTVPTWVRTYEGGGSSVDIRTVRQTTDNGYIMAGHRDQSTGRSEAMALKLDPYGTVQWQKAFVFGGNNSNQAIAVEQVSDGGYIVTGTTQREYGAPVQGWILKLDPVGAAEWQKLVSGPLQSMQLMADGGFAIAMLSGNSYWSNILMVRMDAAGNIQWQKSYDIEIYDTVKDLRQTPDGGLIMAGGSNPVHGDSRAWVMKLQPGGAVEWLKKYVGGDRDITYSIDLAGDGGYIVAGATRSFGPAAGHYDNVWVLKLDTEGNVQWQKVYGGPGVDDAFSVRSTIDGGYIVAGYTGSFTGTQDAWLLKLNGNGTIRWQKIYGKYTGDYYLSLFDHAYSAEETSDGGYIMAGFTNSFNADHSFAPWLLKLDANGAIAGCAAELIQDTNASAIDTNAAVVTSSVTVTNAGLSLMNISITAIDTAAIAKGVCAETSPKIGISPSSLDFGQVEIPGSSAAKTLTISNTVPNTTLTINSITVTGANAGDFTQTNNCSTIAGNGSCTATVTFIPESLGLKTAMLGIASDDPDTPAAEVPLSGTGTDTVAPATVKSVSGRAGSNEWYLSDVTVTLNATDAGSGVKEIHYTVDGAEAVIAGSLASFTISAEGSHSITYYAKDNAGNSETAHPLTISIDKTLPVITANPAPSANANGWNSTDVVVEFTCSDAMSGTASCTSPVTVSTEGAGQIVTGTAVDRAGNTATASVTLNIDKTAPAVASFTVSPSMLWPPNHKMVTVAPAVTVTDANPGTTVNLVSVTSSEPDNEAGDGDTANDIVINSDGTLSLRAERSGAGNGRVYTITYQATDIAGNTSVASATVTVPHNKQ